MATTNGSSSSHKPRRANVSDVNPNIDASANQYVPARVVNSCFENDLGHISVLLTSGVVKKWKLIWSPGRNGEYHIGTGLYEFKEDNNLKAGHSVKFSRRGAENQMIVEIV